MSGIGGGILLRTNPPDSLSNIGNMFFSHCYFENNSAARGASNGRDGKGRGF
jgi:hypothetical protein